MTLLGDRVFEEQVRQSVEVGDLGKRIRKVRCSSGGEAMTSRRSKKIAISPLLFGLLGCGEPRDASPAPALHKGDAPTRTVEPGARKEKAGEPAAADAHPATDAVVQDCVDGEALHEVLFGAAMKTCAESVSPKWAAGLRSLDFDFRAASQQWSSEERAACATACEAWTDELTSLVVPRCADDPHFPKYPGDEVLVMARAADALLFGAAEPGHQRIVADALLAGADASFALARGKTLGFVIDAGAHFLKTYDLWKSSVNATTPGSSARRETLTNAVPTAAHRWEIHKDHIRSLRAETSQDAFPGHRFVLTDAPKFVDETFDTRKTPPEVWDDAVDTLLEFRCEVAWDACEESLRAVPSSFVDGIDEGVMRTLFWTPDLRFADLDQAQREALQASLRARAADYFIVWFNHEAHTVAKIRRVSVAAH